MTKTGLIAALALVVSLFCCCSAAPDAVAGEVSRERLLTASGEKPISAGGQQPAKRDFNRCLEDAGSEAPDNYAIPYFLGLLHLRSGREAAAIEQWEKYLAVAPADFKSASVREQLTVLKVNEAAEYARHAVKQGPLEDIEKRIPENTVAVLLFQNYGGQEFVPFAKALTAMIITDLSKVPELTLLERLKTQAIIDEMRLAKSGVEDFETASKAGKFLLAKRITWGKMETPASDNVRVTAMVGYTLDPARKKDVIRQAPQDRFFDLEKQIVFGILEALEFGKDKIAPSVVGALEKIHTKDLKAFIHFGEGLLYLDRKDFGQAKEAFAKAVKADPGFDMAITARDSTPAVALDLATVDNFGVFETTKGTSAAAAAQKAPIVSIETTAAAPTDPVTDIAQNRIDVVTKPSGPGQVIVGW